MGSEPEDGAPRPTNVTETLVANGGIVSDAFMASSTARVGWSADRAVTELYSMHYRALVRLAALLVRDTPTAEEVVQDSFVAMHGGWQRLRGLFAWRLRAPPVRRCGAARRRSRSRSCSTTRTSRTR